jgi:vitamin B12 transporter
MSIAGVAFAQFEVPDPEEGHLLDTLVISVSRIPESLREVPQSVTIITSEAIEEKNPLDLIDLFKQYGIQIFYEGTETYGNGGIVIRGGKTSMHGFDLGGDTLLLVNGRRSATDFVSGFELGTVERVEIIHGPGAVQYGSAALGGVINIITKRGGPTPEAKVEAGIGSFNESRVKASGSGTISNLDIAAGVSYLRRDNYNTADGTVIDNTDLDRRVNYTLNTGWNFNENHRLGVYIDGSDANGAGKGRGEDSTTASTAFNSTRQKRKNYSVDVSYEGATESLDMTWLVRYFFGTNEYTLSRFYTGTQVPYGRQNNSKSENKFNGAQGQFSWKINNFQLITGVDWLKYKYNQSQFVANPNNANSQIDNLGAFLLAKYNFLPEKDLVLSAGIRYDKFDIKVKSWYRTTTNPTIYHYGQDTELDSWNPSVGLTFSPIEMLKLRTSYGKGYKIPLPRQLGGYTYMSMRPFVGNPELKPEESENFEVGFDFEYKGFTATGTYFDSKFKNMITYKTVNTTDPDYIPGIASGAYYWYYNMDKAKIEGFELGFTYDFGYAFGLESRIEPYFYWTRLMHAHDVATKITLADRAKDAISYGINYSNPAISLSASLDVVRYGNKHSGDINSSMAGSNDHIDDATVVDISFKKGLITSDNFGTLSLKGAIRNVLNEDYVLSHEDFMPGRAFYVGLEYSY